MKLPAGGLAACNRGNKGHTTTGWDDFEDDDWVPFWELDNSTLEDNGTKENSTTTSSLYNTIEEGSGIHYDQNEENARRKRELEREEGLFSPLYSKIKHLYYHHYVTQHL